MKEFISGNRLTIRLLRSHAPVRHGVVAVCRIPWFQWPYMYEIRARPKLLTSPTGSKDLQMVNIGLRVLYRPMISELPNMYRQLGRDYDERVLPSICNEVSGTCSYSVLNAHLLCVFVCVCVCVQCFCRY